MYINRLRDNLQHFIGKFFQFTEKEKTMANTYHKIYLQTVFAVKYRNAQIIPKYSEQIFGVIGQLINETDCKTIIVNGVSDHVHCFLSLKSSVSLSKLMQTIKAKSSKYINDYALTTNRFEWQDGYSAFSYGQSQVKAVYEYVKNQELHHAKHTFKEEYLSLLKIFDVPYDEQYLFEDLS